MKNKILLISLVCVVVLVSGCLDSNQKDDSTKSAIEETQINYRTSFDDYNYQLELKNEDFRLVCIQGCSASDERFNESFSDLSRYVSLLKEVTKTNIVEEYAPFEAHATEDFRCKFASENTLAYANVMRDGNNITRGLMCLKSNEIATDVIVVHELTHLWRLNRFPYNDAPEKLISEGFAGVMSSLSYPSNTNNSFCWEGNSPAVRGSGSSYEDRLYAKGRQLFYELCIDHGFDTDDVPELFNKLDKNPPSNAEEFVLIINEVVGEDTTKTFEKAGVYDIYYTDMGVYWGEYYQ